MKDKEYIVYRHVCPNGQIYIGITCNVKRRWKPSEYKDTSLKPYIDKYGWDAIKHEVLYSCLTRDEALKLEDQLIVNARENDTCLNMQRSGGNRRQTDEYKEEQKAYKKKWYQEHKKEHIAHTKEWYQEHKKEHRVLTKKWYQEHPEKCKVYKKKWRESHREEYNNYYREYRKRKKAEKEAQKKGLF